MNIIGLALLGLALLSPVSWAATAPPLGTLRQFAILGGSAVTGATGAGVSVSGDVGSSPTATVTNFPPSSVAPGFTLHNSNDATVQQARLDADSAATDLANQGPGVALGSQLSGVTLTAGSYSFTSTADLAASGVLTLNGPGIFVFNVATALTANVGSSVLGSADPCKVFWRMGSSATLNGNSFRGTIIASTGFVTVGSSANVTGRMVAATAVTMAGAGGNSIGGCSDMPSLSVQKSVIAYSDPFNATNQPKAIPGAVMAYTVNVSNAGAGSADDASTVITDLVALQVALFVGDLGAVGSGPVIFTQGSPSSGLSYTFTTLASSTDDVDFSADNGATWSYVPVPGSDGCDPLVTRLRSNPKGSFTGTNSLPAPSFALHYRICVK